MSKVGAVVTTIHGEQVAPIRGRLEPVEGRALGSLDGLQRRGTGRELRTGCQHPLRGKAMSHELSKAEEAIGTHEYWQRPDRTWECACGRRFGFKPNLDRHIAEMVLAAVSDTDKEQG